MPTLIPVILPIDEHIPGQGQSETINALYTQSRCEKVSLFQSTVNCALTLAKPENVITIAPFEYASLINEQLAQIHFGLRNHVLLEPIFGKNTGAISAAAHYAIDKFTDPVLWVLPIHQASYYTRVLKHAVTYCSRAAFEGAIVLFGLKPFKPDTNYAYMLTGKHIELFDRLQHLRMFVPHPNDQTIKSMWEQPYCLANSGIFMISATHWLSYVGRTVDALAEESHKQSKDSYYGPIFNPEPYSQLPTQSISKFLGLLSQRHQHPIACYTLPIDTSKQNGWYQLWQESQIDGKGQPLERFLSKIHHAA